MVWYSIVYFTTLHVFQLVYVAVQNMLHGIWKHMLCSVTLYSYVMLISKIIVYCINPYNLQLCFVVASYVISYATLYIIRYIYDIYGHRPPQALHFVGPKLDKHIYIYTYQCNMKWCMLYIYSMFCCCVYCLRLHNIFSRHIIISCILYHWTFHFNGRFIQLRGFSVGVSPGETFPPTADTEMFRRSVLEGLNTWHVKSMLFVSLENSTA